jgi:sorting nexin-17
MQNFESPFLSLQTVNSTNIKCHQLVIRKVYWDTGYDEKLFADKVALNLLYAQTLNDVERGWVECSKEVRRKLTTLQARGAKREYVEMAQKLKYYGYLHFESCVCDYPEPSTLAIVSVGDRELIIRKMSSTMDAPTEVIFRVTRIRCWRLTTALAAPDSLSASITSNSKSSKPAKLELSFEYLMGKDQLRWVTIHGDQVILISICLQGMVEELLRKRNGQLAPFEAIKAPVVDPRRNSWNYMRRDGSCQQLNNMTRSASNDSGFCESRNQAIRYNAHRGSLTNTTRPFVENDAFNGIGDDDL